MPLGVTVRGVPLAVWTTSGWLASLLVALAGTGTGLVFQGITLAHALDMVEGIPDASVVIMVHFLVIMHFLARSRPAIGASEA